MKAVILAGGRGTRLGEATAELPKPLVPIGGAPILWHIMQGYAHHGITDFVVCLGYQGQLIQDYFLHHGPAKNWKVGLIDTGLDTMTGGRVKAVAGHLKDDEAFCLTYGDGVGNVDIAGSIAFHRSHGRDCTMTVAQPPGRFGVPVLEGDSVVSFAEKPMGDQGWVNAGFFVCSPRILDRIEGPDTVWERGPMEGLAADGQMRAWRHAGFWHPMDTPSDRSHLESLWREGQAPWKVW